jgi:hypothetical protein
MDAISDGPGPFFFMSLILSGSIDGRRPFINASGLGLGYPFGLPFPAQVGFEFCEDAKHVKKRLSGRAGGIYRLFGSFETYALCFYGPNDVLKIADAAGDPINAGDHENITLPKKIYNYLKFTAPHPLRFSERMISHPAALRAAI